MTVEVVTVVARNYLPHARVLAQSLAEHAPDLRLTVVLADTPGPTLLDEPFEVVPIEETAFDGFAQASFRYDRLELAVCAKGEAIAHVLERGAQTVLYLDSDIWVRAPLDGLLDAAHGNAITLVPHFLAPLTGDDAATRELDVLRSGAFNGGVLAVTDHPEARRFLAWWRSRLTRHAQYAPALGMLGDQRWLDLVPSYFTGVGVLRDPSVDIAHWNLPERADVLERATLLHFSGFDPRTPTALTRWNPRLAVGDVPGLAELVAAYNERLLAAGWQEEHATSNAWSAFADGTPVPEIARRVWNGLADDAQDRFGDPFACGPGTYHDWLTRPPDGPGPGVTNLWLEVRRLRPDLVDSFPDPLGADREPFLAWVAAHGRAEYAVPEGLG